MRRIRGTLGLLFGSRVPPSSEGLLQEHGQLQGQVVLQLPGHHLHPEGQPLLVQPQRALGDRQPQSVEYSCRKDERASSFADKGVQGLFLFLLMQN